MSARPVGDPAALDAAARRILAIVGSLQGADGFIARALPRRAYEGPGRHHIDDALRSSAQSVGHSAASLERLASHLGAAAGDLRRDQQRWDADDRARREREAKAGGGALGAAAARGRR
jgi:hypothetical protein